MYSQMCVGNFILTLQYRIIMGGKGGGGGQVLCRVSFEEEILSQTSPQILWDTEKA